MKPFRALKHDQEWAAPMAGAFSALLTLFCCLPLGFAGALGAAGLGAMVAPLRPWLIGLAVGLLVFGFVQAYRRTPACRPNRASVAVLWLSAVLVFLVAALPQVVASLLADWLG